LEEVLDDLKDIIPIATNPELIWINLNGPIVKKKGRHEKQISPYINFKNKRLDRLVCRKMKNPQRDHEKSIPVIEIDDNFSEDDIDDWILGNDIDTDTT
jgi:hypothetical protein